MLKLVNFAQVPYFFGSNCYVIIDIIIFIFALKHQLDLMYIYIILYIYYYNIYYIYFVYGHLMQHVFYYRLSHTSCHLYVAFAFFYYAVTYNYVLWTEGVSEINYNYGAHLNQIKFI